MPKRKMTLREKVEQLAKDAAHALGLPTESSVRSLRRGSKYRFASPYLMVQYSYGGFVCYLRDRNGGIVSNSDTLSAAEMCNYLRGLRDFPALVKKKRKLK